jgi:hypothetical protein
MQSGKPEWVHPKEFQVDRAYQPEDRQRRSRIEPMARNWNQILGQGLFGSLRRDGKYWLFDGATRQAAALLHNELVETGELEGSVVPGIWVFGHQGLSVAEEAYLFKELNGRGRLAVHVVHRYQASLISRDPAALAIRNILSRHHLKVATHSSAEVISCVQVLEHLLAWGEDVLDETLWLINRAWPAPTGKATYTDAQLEARERRTAAHKVNVLLGIGAFVHVYREHGFDREDLAAFLHEQDPDELVTAAMAGVVSVNTYTARAAWGKVAALLREDYCTGLPPADVLPRFEQPKRPRAAQTISRSPEYRPRRTV